MNNRGVGCRVRVMARARVRVRVRVRVRASHTLNEQGCRERESCGRARWARRAWWLVTEEDGR